MDLIKELVKEINGPINILLGASSPTVEELENAGGAKVEMLEKRVSELEEETAGLQKHNQKLEV